MARDAARRPEPIPQHHLYDELLMDYAAGGCSEPESLLIASHLALCPCCRGKVALFEEVGGVLLDAIEPAELGEDCLAGVLARIDEAEAENAGRAPAPAVPAPTRCRAAAGARPAGTVILPEPLRSYLGSDIGGLSWRPVIRGLDEIEIPLSGDRARAKLMRIRAGMAVPRHTHEGNELTLVLCGGFSDGRGHFVRGDVAISDAEVDHRPVADPGADCICLAVLDARLKLTGPIGRLLNPFIKL